MTLVGLAGGRKKVTAEQGQGLILDAWGKVGIRGIARPWTLNPRREGTVVTSHQRSHTVVSRRAAQALPSPWFTLGNLALPLGPCFSGDTAVQTVTHGRVRQGGPEGYIAEVSLWRLSHLSSPCH